MMSSQVASGMRVAAAQFASVADIAANLRTMDGLAAAASAQGAELVVFPEAAMYLFTAPAEELATVARSADRVVVELGEIAVRHRIAIVAGLFTPGSGARVRNTLVAVSAKGEVIGGYDKLHLYDAFHYRESDKCEPGALLPDFGELVVLPFGDLKLGLLNCYDLRFPEMARALVGRGANVLVVSSAWVAGPLKEMHWELLLRARAIENTSYVVASCQPGPLSSGLSMIVDPIGLVAATCAVTQGLAIASLELGRLQEVREVLPSLKHCRYRVAGA